MRTSVCLSMCIQGIYVYVCVFSVYIHKKHFKLFLCVFDAHTHTHTHTHTYIYIYIYVYCHLQTDYFVVSKLFSVVRHAGRFKFGSAHTRLYVRLSILPLSPQVTYVTSGINYAL